MTMWQAYHSVVTRSLIVLNFILGSAAILALWVIHQPIRLIYKVSDWLDDRLTDLEERVFESTWLARGKLPAWKDEE